MSRIKAFESAIKRLTLKGLADELGESIQTVNNWRTRGVPASRCVDVERVTGICRRTLRPNDWMNYWPDKAA